MPGHESEAQRVPPEGSLKELGKDIVLTKRMLQHATQLALAEDNQQAEMEKWNLSQVCILLFVNNNNTTSSRSTTTTIRLRKQ